MSVAAGSTPAPVRVGALGPLYRLLLRTQLTVTRLLGIGALSALAILIGVFAALDDNPAQAAADAVSGSAVSGTTTLTVARTAAAGSCQRGTGFNQR